MVSSRVYPSLERKKGGPDNWVERAGGLPDFIERIAKHLHYEQGKSISHSIAAAVNTVKRWARKGKVAKYGDPNNMHVTAATQAKAAKAVAEWYAKRAAGKLIHLTDAEWALIECTYVTDEFAMDLAEEMGFTIDLTAETCAVCKKPATKKVIWADGRAYQPTCDKHVEEMKKILTKKNGKMTELSGVQDLSDAEIDDTSTMVALMLPEAVAKKVAVAEGVPVDDMHITITFNGDTDEATYNSLVKDLQDWAADIPTQQTLKGSIGGIGTFPATDSDQGQPWYIPVDIPGLNTLHEQIKAVADRSAPAAENHGYTPHVTLTYQQPEESAPEPVDSTPVEFSSIWVVRGGDTRVEIHLGSSSSAGNADRATLPSVNLTGEHVDVRALAQRAAKIEDPAARHAARVRVLNLAGVDAEELIDLASTIAPRNARGLASDGRRSYKGQGKWKHGFVPANGAAKEAKAKGSPIAVKRLNRIFGKSSAPDDARKPTREVEGPAPTMTKKPAIGKSPSTFKTGVRTQGAGTGRTGQRSAGGKKDDSSAKDVQIKNKSGVTESATGGLGHLQNSSFADAVDPKTNNLPNTKQEASKQTRIPKRARQNWDEIPDNLKTIRNGKKYVVADFGGQQVITEWVGGIKDQTPDPGANKVYSSITDADALAKSPAELRRLLADPRTPNAVRNTLNAALRKNLSKAASV